MISAPRPTKSAVDEHETEASAMEYWSPATSRRRPNHVVEKKLGELEASLAVALTSRPRRFDVDGSLFGEIHARTDFLRTLIAAERECHGGSRPGHLVDAEERFAVLEKAFEQWARRGVADAAAEEDYAADGSGSAGCSCTDSCFGVECTGPEIEVTFDAKCNHEHETEDAHKAAPVTLRTTGVRRWRRPRTALCGAAGAVAVVALLVGLALEFATVTRQTVLLVPT